MSEVAEYTEEQLEAMLAEKKQKRLAEREAKKQEYEDLRNHLCKTVMEKVVKMHHEMKKFKEYLDHEMEQQAERLNEYGEMRSNSKGGFSIKDSDQDIRITRKRNTQPEWDERAEKAEDLLRDFFSDVVNHRDQKLSEILMSYLVKNKEGQLKYSSVMRLFQHRDKFSDARWVEALRLLEESYRSVLSKYYYTFEIKNEKNGEWDQLSLNMSSL